ncbi:MAG: malic enzyme, partial [Paracoccaceae bacterium]
MNSPQDPSRAANEARDSLNQRAIDLHRAHQGKIEIALRAPLETSDDLSLAYSPGVAAACRAIEADP